MKNSVNFNLNKNYYKIIMRVQKLLSLIHHSWFMYLPNKNTVLFCSCFCAKKYMERAVVYSCFMLKF